MAGTTVSVPARAERRDALTYSIVVVAVLSFIPIAATFACGFGMKVDVLKACGGS